jgi:uncharacterized RDD family membrane protein YckC
MKWFYVENGSQQGPVTEYELRSLRSSGKLTSSSLVWRDGMENWAPYDQSLGEETEVLATPPAIAADIAVEVQSDEPMRYAGFWIRAGAKIIDSLILGAIQMAVFVVFAMIAGVSGALAEGAATGGAEAMSPLLVIATLMLWLFMIVLSIAYPTYFHGKYGATWGKMALGIKVVSPDGGNISYMRSFGRAFAEVLSGMILYIGYIIAAFDGEKKSLHDIMCETRVIYKTPSE